MLKSSIKINQDLWCTGSDQKQLQSFRALLFAPSIGNRTPILFFCFYQKFLIFIIILTIMSTNKCQQQENQSQFPEPFEKIGLCFSGGGFRATFYALGVLYYLDHLKFRQKPLLESVTALSTVSGGTITGVAYTLAQRNKVKFSQFFYNFYKQFSPRPKEEQEEQEETIRASILTNMKYTQEIDNNPLLTKAMKILEDKDKWQTPQNKHKKGSLINAFAIAYSQLNIFCNKQSNQQYHQVKMRQLNSQNRQKNHLKYYCFNATQFYFGSCFQFRNYECLGNFNLKKKIARTLQKKDKKDKEKEKDPEQYEKECQKKAEDLMNFIGEQMRLGDIVASSSCFPVGYEPLVFPHDYIDVQNFLSDSKRSKITNCLGINHNESQQEEQEKINRKMGKPFRRWKDSQMFQKGIGIMDGGITDNQGIGSMDKLNEYMKKDEKDSDDKKGLSLVVVCDVGTNVSTVWKPSANRLDDQSLIQSVVSFKNQTQSCGLLTLYFAVLVIGIILIIVNMLFIEREQSEALEIVGSILAGFGLSLLLVLGLMLSCIKYQLYSIFRKKLKKQLTVSKRQRLEDIVDKVEGLDLRLSQRMLTERLTSTLQTITTVFFSQIMRLNYTYLFSKPDLKDRRIAAMIYKLNGVDDKYSKGKGKGFNQEIKKKPSKVLQSVCLTAAQCPTALWWTDDDIAKNRMDCLIACGQFTICYELLNYLLKLSEKHRHLSKEYTEVLEQLQKDWKNFNNTPMMYAKPPPKNSTGNQRPYNEYSNQIRISLI